MTTTTRPTFAEFLASPAPERIIPARRVECELCMGSGEIVNGFTGYAPNQERCTSCNGFGHVAPACNRCADKGEYVVSDMHGDHDGVEYCQCHAGHRLREADTINAVKAAHEATLADYDAHSHDRIDAGDTPF